MNVNLLITENNLQTTGRDLFPSKPDQSNKGAKFSLNTDDKPSQVSNLKKTTTDNINKEIQNQEETVNESPYKLTQSNSQTLKSENTYKTEKGTKSKGQIETSDTIKRSGKQQNLIQNRPDNNSVFIEHSNSATLSHTKEGATTKDVPNSGQQVAQINANIPARKSSTVTEHAVKSAEIKLLHATDKGQLGLKTVLPAKSNGENGLKTVLPKTLTNTPEDKIQPEKTNNSVLTKTIAETKSATDKSHTTESVTEISVNTSKKTNVSIVKPAVENINPATIQSKIPQVQSQSSKSTHQGFEQILSHNNSHTIITEQNPSAAKTTTTGNTPSQNSSHDVSADIGRQISESLQKSASQQGVDRQITIRLNPPELGKVFIKFHQHDNELTGLMEVSKNQTRLDIEQTLPQIIRNLADSGIQVKRLEVTLSNEQQSGQGTSSNQSLQSGSSQQQYSGNPGTSGNDTDVHEGYEWLASNNSYEDPGELQGTLITDSSINLLI